MTTLKEASALPPLGVGRLDKVPWPCSTEAFAHSTDPQSRSKGPGRHKDEHAAMLEICKETGPKIPKT